MYRYGNSSKIESLWNVEMQRRSGRRYVRVSAAGEREAKIKALRESRRDKTYIGEWPICARRIGR